MNSNKTTRRGRMQKGQAIAEFGPALFLLIVIFFAFVDLMNIGTTYLVCFTLNDSQAVAASTRTELEVRDTNGVVQKALPEAWTNSGLGQFVQLQGSPETTVGYKDLLPGGPDKIVTVTTVVRPRPMIYFPFFPGIPGLSAPMQFSYYAERVVERPSGVTS